MKIDELQQGDRFQILGYQTTYTLVKHNKGSMTEVTTNKHTRNAFIILTPSDVIIKMEENNG